MSNNLLERYFTDTHGRKNILQHICPGIWFSIHTDPLINDDDDHLEAVIEKLIYIVNNFFCEKCRYHLKLFYNNVPIRDYVEDKMDAGYPKNVAIFRWTWLLHNNVNDRLGKEWMPFQLAYNMYNQTVKLDFACSVCKM